MPLFLVRAQTVSDRRIVEGTVDTSIATSVDDLNSLAHSLTLTLYVRVGSESRLCRVFECIDELPF